MLIHDLSGPTPRVSVVIECTENREAVRRTFDATMFGTPTRVAGKATSVEVVTDTGRHTLVPFADVTALNDAALALLTAPGPKKKEVALA